MQFCLIDSDAAYRQKLRYHLQVEWPDARIIEFEHATDQVPSIETLADCDAVLLACPKPGKVGLDGLNRFFDREDYPPVILFADAGDELLAVDALKAGAASYFPKQSVQHLRLIDTLRTELGAERASPVEALAGGNGPYRLIRELHVTDLATVCLAEMSDGAAVEGGAAQLAVKLIRYVPDAGSGNLFDRFLQEYELIAGIDHPNVVKIFDLGVADDHAYIAMEYLDAGRLSDRLVGALAPPIALEYLAQIAGALDAVHRTGILHRDLKPSNIMFRNDNSLALIDFGLAKWMQLEAALTGKGQIFGTPYYMSPEQGHAEQTDERSDLYSLGCILYEMLTGSRPYTASTAMGVIYQHANAKRPKLEAALVRYQPLVDSLMAIAPEARFQTAGELLNSIEALSDPAARSFSRTQ
jgi:serine/threonine protein kinase